MTKLHIDLPHHWAATGESLWARALGGDLYRLENVPFLAYDLNFGDVVRATPDRPGLAPEIRSVVARSGHRTLRLFFAASLAEEHRRELLRCLAPLSVSFERADSSFFALDLAPEADMDEVRAELEEWVEDGWAEYETCEARVKGSFDDPPEEHVH